MDNPFTGRTYAQSLADIVARFAMRDALIFRDRRYNFADLKAEADSVSARLAALGLGRGDKIAILMPNRWDDPHELRHSTQGYVVAKAGAALGGEDIMVRLRPKLASYKRPERVYFVEELPLTSGTGKVQKFKLRADALARLADKPDAAREKTRS